MPDPTLSLDSFKTFGDLLKYLRRREHLTQLELSIAVGYSEAQIGRLEKNQRRPDLTALKALFIPALHMEDKPELISRFLELAQSSRQEDTPAPGVAPYKGLLFFDESDAELFFGREALTAHLLDRVSNLAFDSTLRFLAIVGASGSGKSSLARAGLAVALQQAGWEVHIFTPGADPCRTLDAQLKLNQDESQPGQLLLLVDQFEETFTLCHNESERLAFIEKLLCLAEDSSQTTVVIALRADFYSHCAQYPLLREAVAARQEYIGQMTARELRHAIEEPARRSGWEIEPGLVDLLLVDIGAQGTGEPEPGALPLLSHALLATWERRRGRKLTQEGYHASGGVRGAIAETAESVFNDQLNQTQQELARAVFLRLTELGEGTEDTRRRAALNELVRQSAEATQLRAVLNTLAEARLITLNADSAEVAHEALIREWQRLHEWLTQDRDGLLLHRHLTETAQEWESRGHDPAELYRGARLAQAYEWAAIHEERLNAAERAFLTASMEQEAHAALEREAQRQRELEVAQKLAETERSRAQEQTQSAKQLRTRNRVITTVGSIALILALLAGLFGVRADSNFNRAEAQRLALEANRLVQSGGSSEQIALLSLRSMKTHYTPEGDAALAAAAGLQYPVKSYVNKDIVKSVTFSPDGKYLLTGNDDATATLWDVESRQEVRRFTGHTAGVLKVRFSPDGKNVLTISLRDSVRMWDAGTGQEIYRLATNPPLNDAVYSFNGKTIYGSSEDKTIRQWDAISGKEAGIFLKTPEVVSRMVISPDGGYLLTLGSTAQLWDLQTGQEVCEFSFDVGLIQGVDFSPDGSFLLTGNTDGKAYLWDVKSGDLVRTFTGHSGPSYGITFSPDNKYLLTSAGDRSVRIWDIHTGQELRRFTFPGYVEGLAVSPDGKWMLIGGDPGLTSLWAMDAKSYLPVLNQEGGINAVAFSPDGRWILTGGTDGAARLWDSETGENLRDFKGHTDAINYGAAFSPDGKYIVTGSWDSTVRIWDPRTGEQVRQFVGDTNNVQDAVYSPDGSYILTAGYDGVRLRDVQTGDEIRRFGDIVGVYRAIFSPDGNYVLTSGSSGDGVARLWKASTGQMLREYPTAPGDTGSVDFSPDGRYVIADGGDRSLRLWNVQSGKELRQFIGHTSAIYTAVFSPDGRYIATASADGTARLWDVQTGQELRRFAGHAAGVENVAFSPDGKYILTGSDDGTARLWDVDDHTLVDYLCFRLLRDFTEEERSQYGITDSSPTCPSKP